MKLRVVSYNVLSSRLATPSSYPTLNPDHLDPSNRLKIILNKLDAETRHHPATGASRSSSSCVPTIFALQEVSYDWAGEFHTFFANRGYHFVTGLYGQSYNGYMGVALAWPLESFTCIETNISRLSDHRIGGWPKKAAKNAEGPLDWFIQTPLKMLGLYKDPQECNWKMSQRKFNVLVGATLQHKETGQTICVGTYHMPCAFYAPPTMTLHADMAIRHIQEMSQRAVATISSTEKLNNDEEGDTKPILQQKIPYLLAGDFNIKPDDGVYKYLTTNVLEPTDHYFPPPPLHDPTFTWNPSILEPVTSAYAMYNGKEPDFTNYAFSERDSGAFIDTLDYIFLSPDIRVTEVLPIPNRDDAKGPFPNLDADVNEPSDHILIAATVEISPSLPTASTSSIL